MNTIPRWYHLHVYFDHTTSEIAAEVRDHLAHSSLSFPYLGRLIPRAVGPHDGPMFEAHVSADELDEALALLEHVRGPLSVLVHPVVEDELAAHSELAQWLGDPKPVHLDRL